MNTAATSEEITRTVQAMAAPDLTRLEVHVYAGRHYGRRHRVLRSVAADEATVVI